MTFLRLLPLLLSCLVMAAHVFRMQWPLVALAVLGAPLLLVLRGPGPVRILQGMLGLFALEWVRTAWVLASWRAEAGQPMVRLLVILLGVAALTALAAWPLEAPARGRKKL